MDKHGYRLFSVEHSIFVLLTVTIGAFINFAPTFGTSPQGDSLAIINASPNFKDGRFRNLVETVVDTPTPEQPRSFQSLCKPAPGNPPCTLTIAQF